MTGTGIPVVLSCIYFLTFPDDAIEKGKVAAALAGGIIYTRAGVSLLRKGKKNKEKALSINLGMRAMPMPVFTVKSIVSPPSLVLLFRF